MRDGDRLSFGAAQFATMRAPGHTPASTSYLLAERALFAGDTLFLDGAGRTELEALAALYRSLGRLLALSPGSLFLPDGTSEAVARDGEPLAGRSARREGDRIAWRAKDALRQSVPAGSQSAPPKHARLIESTEPKRSPMEVPRAWSRRDPPRG